MISKCTTMINTDDSLMAANIFDKFQVCRAAFIATLLNFYSKKRLLGQKMTKIHVS